jgi:hypothetical protein
VLVLVLVLVIVGARADIDGPYGWMINKTAPSALWAL